MLPILFQSHDFILYSYPLLMGLGWGVGYQIFFSKKSPELSNLKAQLLFWGIFLFAWIGAKILFYITYPENVPTALLGDLSFWTGGGFVFYGGFIGGLIFLALYKKTFPNFSYRNLWPLVPALALGHGIGRIGCFLAGCCYGKPTDFFWGVYLHDHYRHPTQLIEALGLLILGLYLFYSKKSPKFLLGIYLSLYGVLRFYVETLRGDLVRGQWGALTPSEWISCSLVISGAYLLIQAKKEN